MKLLPLAVLGLAAAGEMGHVELWMQQAFYPALLGILIIASLGIPIPEDIPLIAAGVLLRTNPEIASPWGTVLVALIGIMTGDLVLYTLGRRWGPNVVNHRSVRWMITPARFESISSRFHQYGAWFCFFGRFFMGVRAAMCMTAGATRFPYWRFFLADCAGALLSIPLFIVLGYAFAGMIPTLRVYLGGIQAALLLALIVVSTIALIVYKIRKVRRLRAAELAPQAPAATALAANPAPAIAPAMRPPAPEPASEVKAGV
jgi:membrane protein DedA with SNARE-associated domain